MVDKPHYRAFISYSHSDQAEARWLHRAIETYRVPKAIVGVQTEYGVVPARLGKVFRDEEELAGAAQLGDKLQDALRNSAALIVICSPKACGSFWVDNEIRYFKQVNPTCPVLAVIVKGTPNGEDACFPEALLYGVKPNGEIDRAIPMEPLAPDMQKLDHSVVKLKLIAGLLGVAYDDLARRELKRARRQQALIATVTTVIIVALAGLAGAAMLYANGERKARIEAEKQTWLANQARDQIMQQFVLAPDDKPAPKAP